MKINVLGVFYLNFIRFVVTFRHVSGDESPFSSLLSAPMNWKYSLQIIRKTSLFLPLLVQCSISTMHKKIFLHSQFLFGRTSKTSSEDREKVAVNTFRLNLRLTKWFVHWLHTQCEQPNERTSLLSNKNSCHMEILYWKLQRVDGQCTKWVGKRRYDHRRLFSCVVFVQKDQLWRGEHYDYLIRK